MADLPVKSVSRGTIPPQQTLALARPQTSGSYEAIPPAFGARRDLDVHGLSSGVLEVSVKEKLSGAAKGKALDTNNVEATTTNATIPKAPRPRRGRSQSRGGSKPPKPQSQAAADGPRVMQRSWVAIAKAATKVYALTYIPPSHVENRIVATLTDETLEATDPKWSECLVGYLVGKRLPFKLVESVTKEYWGSHLLEVMANEDGFFFFHVPDLVFRRKILDSGPTMVARVPLFLQQWHPLLELKRDDHESVPVRIRLKNIPFALWSAPGISSLASVIGKPLYVDQRTESMKMISYARVSVEIKANQQLKDFVEVLLNGESRIIKVDYEWRPKACVTCGTFGHQCPPAVVLPDPVEIHQADIEAPAKCDVAPPAQRADPRTSMPLAQWRKMVKKKGRLVSQGEAVYTSEVGRSSDARPRGDAATSDLRPPVDPAPLLNVPLEQPQAARLVPLGSSDSEDEVEEEASLIGSMDEVEVPRLPTSMQKIGNTPFGTELPSVKQEKTQLPPIVDTSPQFGSDSSPTVSLPLFPTLSTSPVPNWKWVANYEYSPRGRIWVGWNPCHADFVVSASSAQVIHGHLRLLDINKACFLSVIYAEHTFVSRRPLWADLVHTSSLVVSSPWLVAGDFNAIKDPSDRIGSSNVRLPSFNELGECITQAGLEDLHYVGHRFTWSNSSTHPRKQRKIDRALINARWCNDFSYSEASFLAPGVSDHSPIVIKITAPGNYRRPFKFFNFWMSPPSFMDPLTQVWNTRVQGIPMFILTRKLKLLKVGLKQLNRDAFSDISARTANARAVLTSTRDAQVRDPFNHVLAALERDQLRAFSDLRLREEGFYKQK
ncbi:uncharacterized protein LOC125314131 [Rhodamnia argentea]|uniref:Uncharacterized protein LOC125314131 n=1 Tax=Rhodamnia argentea TaxID=178133 RepID=A0ABM3H4R6_9MYRT|nr:uncharacterized protein LOC125314131 [Rhodamnia argentea]